MAEHDQTWIDPSFTSPLTGVVARLMREAGRAASPDPVDDARRLADALRLRDATSALAWHHLGPAGLGIEEGEVADPQFVAALHDVAAGRMGRLTPEQNAALRALTATSVRPSELDARLAENGFDLPEGHPDRRALGLVLLRTAVRGLEDVGARDAGAAIDTPARPPVMAPATEPAPPDKPPLSAMRERWRKDERPKDKQDDDNPLHRILHQHLRRSVSLSPERFWQAWTPASIHRLSQAAVIRIPA